jgi:Bacterial Ig-like domain (group 1)
MITLSTSLRLGCLLFVASCNFAHPADVPVDAVVTDEPAKLVETSGDNQNDVVGAQLAMPLVVTVEDANGTGMPGIEVDFAVTTGGGTVGMPAVATDANGVAQTTLALGASPGANTVSATCGSIPGAIEVFTETAHLGTVAQLVRTSGTNQMATVATALALPLVVTAVDSHGNPTPGVVVNFVPTAGGSTVAPASATTDTQGHATTHVTVAQIAGPTTIEARASGLTSVAFSELGIPGQATTLVKTSGNHQTAVAGSQLAAPLIMKVEDQFGNGVPGVDVTFAATSGGGSITTSTIASDPSGQAQTTAAVGTIAGANSYAATANGLTGSPFTFAETGVAGAPARITGSGSNQLAFQTVALAAPFVATVFDSNNNRIPDIAVTFQVTAGGGSLSTTTTTTDANGTAETVLTLGSSPGTNTVEATVSGASFAFNATAAASGPPEQLVPNTPVFVDVVPTVTPFTLQVLDAANRPVTNVAVVLTVLQAGGCLQTAQNNGAELPSCTATLTYGTDGQGQVTTFFYDSGVQDKVEAHLTSGTGLSTTITWVYQPIIL